MPDFQDFDFQAMGDAALTVGRYRMRWKVVDSQTGAVQQDFTGANAIQFGFRIPGLSAAKEEKLARKIAHMIACARSGIEDPD
jgi:hypothetical protein